jgi:hypothetical protein
MTSKAINEFKEVMHQGMIANFKIHGFLTPVVFFYKDGEALISEIPHQLLSTPEGKSIIAAGIKDFCTQPNVFAAGMIIEAYGAAIGKDEDDEMTKLINNGNMRVRDLKQKQDIIVMISYVVDPNSKTVGKRFVENGHGATGRFSNFFSWNKN